jgi:hypothetical protein
MRAVSLVGSLRFVATRSMHDVVRHLGARSAPASLLSENWLTYIYVGNVSVNTLFFNMRSKARAGSRSLLLSCLSVYKFVAATLNTIGFMLCPGLFSSPYPSARSNAFHGVRSYLRTWCCCKSFDPYSEVAKWAIPSRVYHWRRNLRFEVC